MRIKFNLKRPKAESETAVIARVTYAMNDLRVYTGVSVNPKYWNPATRRVKITTSYRPGSSINTRLDQIHANIEKSFYDYENEHGSPPPPATFREIVNAMTGRSKVVKLDFLSYFTDFIERTDRGDRRTKKGKIVAPSKAYMTTLNRLKDFNRTWIHKLDFDTIDMVFYDDYLKYLKDKGLAENTLGKDIKNIKAVLNEATEKGINTNLIYKSDRFTKPREDVDSIALSENDLKDILHFDLSATPHLDRVRDLFLVACHTGLRYSDFSKLTAENVRDGFIEIARQQKTGKPVVIPVHPTVKAIIKKYGGDLPESVSNQKMNEYIKDACKQVDCMKEYTTKTATKGGVKVTHRYKKWQVTSTHTGRRTFATNAYRQGIPTITIMAVTGHKTEKAFLSYIKVSPREHAEIMAAHWAKRAQMKIAN